jgi:DNA-binding MarR family transcriptional regulator
LRIIKAMKKPSQSAINAAIETYRLDEQVGFLLRRANQRHTAIFAAEMPYDLTPTQFAVLVKLEEVGACSQNHLGRLTAMDVATIKGVVDRLKARRLVAAKPDAGDRRRTLFDLSREGLKIVEDARRAGALITELTLKPLSSRERTSLLRLLEKISD